MFSSETCYIPDSEEIRANGRNYISWGLNNDFPQYLKVLLDNNSLLQTITEGISQYVSGNSVNCLSEGVLGSKVKFNKLIQKCMQDRLIYGGFAIQVIYNPLGEISNLKHVAFERLRIGDNEATASYYKYWGVYGKRYTSGLNKAITYPLFGKTKGPKTSEIFYYNQDSSDIYPKSPINGCLRSIETSNEVSNFHYHAIKNNFAVSAIINFNNGIPTENEKKAINDKLSEAFTGTNNASRFLVSFNESSDNATTLDRLASDDFDKRYEALDKSVRDNIFVNFRCSGILFGLPEENRGFSKAEYTEAFELFNSTVVKSYQIEITEAFSDLGIEIEIEPFTLNTIEGGEVNE